MTDKELLELAATAHGDLVYVPDMGWIAQDEHGNRGAWWNPLGDDGDALRLAVKLEMFLDLTIAMQECADVDANEITEVCNADPYAAVRRAIVRAAAEIGKEMK